MKRIITLLMILATLIMYGCSEENVKEVFETAQLEELQKNYDHARELYRKIWKNIQKARMQQRIEKGWMN
jgi:uncharacterized protein YjaZ